MLFGVGAAEVRVFVAILVVVAATAALIPAIRASRIHPSDALRHE
jgi:ABC-type antimicrobial peptide transport system permease subunit